MLFLFHKIAEYCYNWNMSKKSARYDKDGLTSKQAKFAAEYLKDYNCLRAAIRAGYAKKGAQQQGSVLLSNPKVSRVIDRYREENQSKIKVDAQYMLQRLAQIDRMKISDILKDGKVIPLEDWPDIWQEMTLGQIDTMVMGDEPSKAQLLMFLNKLKFPDKMKNLELLGKHIDVKAFADVTKVEHGLTDEAASTIKDVLKRIDGKSTGIRVPQALPEPDDGT